MAMMRSPLRPARVLVAALAIFFAALGFLSFSPITHAANWSGIIAPSRAIDWTAAGVQGGIPSRTTVCQTLSPGATSAQIDSAIASCPAGQVVYLNAGTYNLAAGITFGGHSNVTLRGAGPDKTTIVFTGDDPCNGIAADICVAGSNNWQGGPQNVANWTGGYSAGTTQITLDNTSNLHAGGFITLDQVDPATDPGTIWACNAMGVCSTEGTGGATRPSRSQEQLVTVTAVNGSTVTITPGIYLPNWSAAQQPGAWWPSQVVTGDGVEDMSVDHTSSNDKTGIGFSSASNSWVDNVRSLNPNRNHVWLYGAVHISVLNSYLYGTQNAAITSYGVETYQTSDNLIMNNIIQHVTSPLVPGVDTGSVYAYNYTTDDYYTLSVGWLMQSYQPHGATPGMTLFEGNDAPGGFRSDAIHGTHDLLTLFRNRLNGYETGMTNNTIPVAIESFGRYYNIIGNVLGQAGYHTQYQDLAPSGSNAIKSIYVLGWAGSIGRTANIPNDTNVISTLMRWGNYDTVTNAAQWNAAEVPSTLSFLANPLPSSQSLPASFFLSSQPSFWKTPWGTPPWPAIGPDVTGGNGPGGHSYYIPARLCYINTPKDANGILLFNADNCYATSTVSTAPPDTTAPTTPASLTASAASASAINLSWTASTDPDNTASQLTYRVYRSGTLIATVAPGVISYSDTGLSASTAYSYTVAAVDPALNASGQTSPVSATTQASTPTDTIPPTTSITSPANGATVSGTVTVQATASDNVGVTKVEFYLDGALKASDASSPYAWSWNTGGTANGSHSLQTKAYDAAGNVGSSAAVTVTVSNTSGDTTPPTQPTNLTAGNITANSVTLSWTASTDNVGVAYYAVYRNGTPVATVNSGTTYNDTNLQPSTSYTYWIIAYDAANNASTPSTSFTATTLPASGGTSNTACIQLGMGLPTAPPYAVRNLPMDYLANIAATLGSAPGDLSQAWAGLVRFLTTYPPRP